MKVLMYTTAVCPYCQMAERLLASKGVNVEKVRIDLDPVRRAEINTNTIIRIKNTIALGERNLVNSVGATFYMGDINTDAEKISIKGKNTIVNANIYMLRGTLSITNNDVNAVCIMNGTQIVETIMSEKNVTWSAFDCNAVPAAPQFMQAENSIPEEESFSVSEQKPILEKAKSSKQDIAVYPSPATGSFTLQLNAVGRRADVIIVNQSGVEILRESHLNITKGREFKFDISNYPSGLYYIKVTTENGVCTRQIVITK